jgi:hypothetical protein
MRKGVGGIGRRLKRQPFGVLFVLMLFVALVVMVVWLAAVRLIFDVAGLASSEWGWLEGVTSVLTFAFAAGAGLLLLIEYSDADETRNLEIYRDIYDRLMTPQQIEARRKLYQDLPDDPGEAMHVVRTNPEYMGYYKQVLSLIDYFGFVVQQEWVTADEVIGWISPIVVKVWDRIGELVEMERDARKGESDYHIAAFELAKACQDWRDEHIDDWEQALTFGDRLRV